MSEDDTKRNDHEALPMEGQSGAPVSELPLLIDRTSRFLGHVAIAGGVPYTREQYERLKLGDVGTFTSGRPMPRLVKFFPDATSANGINYSRQALNNQTVYLADPKSFNDPYDCVMGYDERTVRREVLRALASELGCNLDEENLADGESRLADHLSDMASNELPRLKSIGSGSSSIWSHLSYYNMVLDVTGRSGNRFDRACVDRELSHRMHELDSLLDWVGVSCFTRELDNTYMWAHYAQGYRGFAIEYDITQSAVGGNPEFDALRDVIVANIWDVFYVHERPLCTSEAIRYLTSNPDMDMAAALYVKALCSKHTFWMAENECRLVLNVTDERVVQYGRNIPFFPAKRIYLGANMAEKDKADICELCSRLPHPPEVLEMVTDSESFTPKFEAYVGA